MDPFTDAMNDLFASIQSHYLAYLTAVSSIGVLSMALIQMLKDLLPLKSTFQRFALRQWILKQIRAETMAPALTQAAKNARQHVKRGEAPADPEERYRKAEQDLILLATAGDAGALYDLETEQLCGQINAAVQVTLDGPWRYPELFQCLAAKADDQDVELLLQHVTGQKLHDAAGALTEEGKALLEARNRVTHMIQRNVDAFQIESGYRWQWWMKLLALALSFMISFAGLILLWKHGEVHGLGRFFMAILIAVLSGFLAPVARDVIAAVQALRD